MAFWDKWFKKKPKAANTKPLVAAAGKPQTRDYYDNLFMQFGGYIQLKGSLDVYDMIRELLPICDVAPIKRARLVGDFRLDGLGNKSVQDALDNFYRNVRVGLTRAAGGQRRARYWTACTARAFPCSRSWRMRTCAISRG
jgi:ABC-type ATPase with predicted acetyltransferase domain